MVGRCFAAAFAVLACTTAASADEAEIVARYNAYVAAFSEGRYADAGVEGEAAWRAAEAEWGAAREETAVLAFNLARLRLMLEQQDQAIEPALRVLALIDAGAAGASIPPAEANLVGLLAKFNVADPSREEIETLKTAVEGYTPTDFAGRRIHWISWAYVAAARFERRQWRPAYEAAERATLSMQDDPSAAPATLGAVAVIGVKSAYEIDKLEEAIILGHRGIAAFPFQPPEQPIEPVLGNLLGWDAGLHNVLDQRGDALSEEDYPEPDWNEGRYPTAMGCDVEWIEHPAPRFPMQAVSRGEILAMLFEYYLDADGTVIRVDPVGNVQETAGFADAVVTALRTSRAAPQPRAECRGPWLMTFYFQFY